VVACRSRRLTDSVRPAKRGDLGLSSDETPVCAVKYCTVCKKWDREHREGKAGLGGHTATTLVCFEDVGTPFWTAITAATIHEVRKLKAAGYTRQEIADRADVSFSMVRSALRMRILDKEEVGGTV